MSTNGSNGSTNGKSNGSHHSPTLSFLAFSNVINGELTTTKETRNNINPSTLEENPPVPVSTHDDVDKAVDAARAAQPKWADTPVEERRKAIVALADAISDNRDAFVEMLVKEQGKPVFAASLEVDSAIKRLKAATKLELTEEIVEETETHQTIVRYTPLGVCVGIVPWNFPFSLACMKIAPAMMTGNAIIIKPSPFTPYCGLKLVELAQAFFPPGILQVLSGDDNLGPWLTEHPGVDKISFTGSSATGKLVMKSAAKTLKRITLELGGNDPAIVCPSVDISQVAPQIARFAFMNSGQICIAIKRIYVHASIYDEFLAAFTAFVRTLKVGDGFDKDVFLGPLQNEMQYNKVSELMDDIEAHGLKVATSGMKMESDKDGAKGYFIHPMVIDNPDDGERIVRDEPFGPLVPLLKWTEEAEVLTRANNTDMGLGSSIWTRDMQQANRLARQLKAGSVWINSHMVLGETAAFGGHKHSGIGSEGGVYGLKAYTNVQSLYMIK